MNNHKGYGYFTIKHVNQRGTLLFEETKHNNLARDGEKAMLDVFFRNGAAPTVFHLAVAEMNIMNSSNTIEDVIENEPTTGGYTRVSIERNTSGWTQLEMENQIDYVITSKECAFAANGSAFDKEVDHVVILATIGGVEKLIAYAPLSQPRLLQDGDTLYVTYKMKLSNEPMVS